MRNGTELRARAVARMPDGSKRDFGPSLRMKAGDLNDNPWPHRERHTHRDGQSNMVALGLVPGAVVLGAVAVAADRKSGV